MNHILILLTGFFLLIDPKGQTAIAAASLPAQQSNASESTELVQARGLINGAVTLYKQGKPKKALDPAKRGLQILEKTLAPDDNRVIEAKGNLASIYVELRKFKEAEGLYKQLLEAYEKQAGAQSAAVAATLNILAALHYARGEVSLAESEYKRSLAISDKTVGAHSAQAALTLFQLAELYHGEAELEKAQPLYQRLLGFDDKLVLEENTTVEDARHRFHCLLQKMNKHDAASALFPNSDKPADRQDGPLGVKEGGTLIGRAVRLQKPTVPDKAWEARASGPVPVFVTISETGNVIRACAVKGHPLLWHASERAAMDSKFAPTLLNGNAVKVTGVIVFTFGR